MKIALIGHGKMGRSIERLAREAGHEIVSIITENNPGELKSLSADRTDVAIEFTQPESAFNNISTCIRQGVKLISGTTGWLHRYPEIADMVAQQNGTFLHASNFSTGVNLFFELNEWLSARTGNSFRIEMEETHHTEKKDAPSGTAIRIAEGILSKNTRFTDWSEGNATDDQKIPIVSHREPNVPGTHIVKYVSEYETIELTHVAHHRDVFAQGALHVAEWISGQEGLLTMNDYLNKK